MDKYFKVPMAAACAIANVSEDLDILAGYIVLNRYAMPKKYQCTAAGANAIHNVTGLSDFRSKQVLIDLRTLRFAEWGTRFLIQPTGTMVRNAREFELGQWDGAVAYLPDLLTQGHPTPLSRLIRADAAPDVRRDALLLLLHVYASVDYAGWFGVDPEAFVYTEWRGEGEYPVDGLHLDLGLYGKAGELNFWLMREGDRGKRVGKRSSIATLFGAGEIGVARFRSAFDLLRELGMLCRVAIVETAGTIYPLWVFSQAYREGLRRAGVTSDLGRLIYNAADRARFDPDNRIISEAVSGEVGATGTTLFFAVTTSEDMPIVRTIFAPLFHAPTPINLNGLRVVNARTQVWVGRLETIRRERQVA